MPGLIKQYFENQGILEDTLAHLREIGSATQLAPSLGAFVEHFRDPQKTSSLEGFAKPDYFLPITELTDQFKSLLKDVVSAFKERNQLFIPLNVEMGSGKTHFLVLLFHLFYIIPRNKFVTSHPIVKKRLEEIQRISDYTIDLAENVLIIPADLIGHGYKTLIKFVATALSYIHSSIQKEFEAKSNELLPEALGRWLAEKLYQRIHVLILIDELYAALRRSDIKSEIIKILKFLYGFIERRISIIGISRDSGLVCIVASARQDLRAWQEEKSKFPDKDLVREIESFEKRFERRVYSIRGEWFRPEDIIRIVKRRIIRYLDNLDSLYKLFLQKYEKLIKDVLGVYAEGYLRDLALTYPFAPSILGLINKILAPEEDSDVPDAHHLRGLLKSLAKMTINAIYNNEDVISPALGEFGILGDLIPKRRAIWEKALKNAMNFIDAVLEDEKQKEFARKLLWAIFLKSITQRDDKLLKLARIKTLKEAELQLIRDLLADQYYLKSSLIGLKNVELRRIDHMLEILENYAGNVYHISLGDISGYVMITYENPKSIFRRMVNNRREKYEKMVIPELLNAAEGIIESRVFRTSRIDSKENITIELIDPDKDSIIKSLKRADNSRLRIYIVRSWKLYKQMKENITNEEVISLLNDLVSRIERAYEEAKANQYIFLTAVIIPSIDTDLVRDFLKSYCIFDVAGEFIRLYYEEPRSLFRNVDEDWLRFYEQLRLTIINDILRELGNYVAEYSKSALKLLLGGAIVYYSIFDNATIKDRFHEQVYLREAKEGARVGKISVRDVSMALQHLNSLEDAAIKPIIPTIIKGVTSKLKFTSDKSIIRETLKSVLLEYFKVRKTDVLRIPASMPVIYEKKIISTKEIFDDALKALSHEKRIKISEELEIHLEYVNGELVVKPIITPTPKTRSPTEEVGEIKVKTELQRGIEPPLKPPLEIIRITDKSEILNMLRNPESAIFSEPFELRLKVKGMLSISIKGRLSPEEKALIMALMSLINQSDEVEFRAGAA